MVQFTQQGLGIQSSTLPTLPALSTNTHQPSGSLNRPADEVIPSDRRSLSPVLRRKRNRQLSPMSNNFKKTLHVSYINLWKGITGVGRKIVQY
jgi:hypothetical protein